MTDKAVLFELPSIFRADAVVGQGAYGAVCRVRVVLGTEADGQAPRIVAVKKIPGYAKSGDAAKRVLRELIILQSFHAVPQVVTAHAFFRPGSQEKDVYIVMNYVPSDVSTFLKQTQQLTPQIVQYMIAQLLLGLRALHRCGCIHRDLSTRNVLLDSQCNVQIADFGLARFYDPQEQMSFGVVTQWYRAPEIITDARYDTLVDVWSAGVIMAELLMQGHLFPGKPNDLADQLNRVMRILGVPDVAWFTDPASQLASSSENAKRYVERASRSSRPFRRTLFTDEGPKFRLETDDAARDLLSQMLTFNPERRPTADAALRHPYFDSLRPYITEASAYQDQQLTDDEVAEAAEALKGVGRAGVVDRGDDAIGEIERMAPVWSPQLEADVRELFSEMDAAAADQ